MLGLPEVDSSNQLALKTQLKGKLNQTRIVYRGCDYPEISGRVSIIPGQSKLRMIEQIEELSPEIQIRTLTKGQRYAFDDREIRIDKVGSVDGCARSTPKFARSGVGEALRVKPLIQSGAGGLGATGLVRTVQVVSVVRQVYAGTVVAGNEKHRKT